MHTDMVGVVSFPDPKHAHGSGNETRFNLYDMDFTVCCISFFSRTSRTCFCLNSLKDRR